MAKVQTVARPSERLSEEQLLDMYYYMVLSRKLDERMWILNRQGKAPFHISGIGHEAIQVAQGFAMRKGHDWLFPHYRDIATCLILGVKPLHMLLALLGKEGDIFSRGRQMPEHFNFPEAKIVSVSSPVATQIPQAVGVAFGIQRRGTDEVVLVGFGEGSTSEGDFHEGLNWAGIYKLPVVFVCQNNQYAISVPMEKQMPVQNVADRAAAYGMPGVIVDGNNVLESYDALVEAIERARRGEGPTLIEAKTYRPVPHSSADDDRSYRSREEVEMWKQRDPILLFEKELTARGLLDEEKRQEIHTRVEHEVEEAVEQALQAPYPPVASAHQGVYGEFRLVKRSRYSRDLII